jgi:hypothetical protein
LSPLCLRQAADLAGAPGLTLALLVANECMPAAAIDATGEVLAAAGVHECRAIGPWLGPCGVLLLVGLAARWARGARRRSRRCSPRV